MTPDSTANKQLVRRWVDELFNSGRLDVAADVVAAHFTEHALAPFGQAAPGEVDGPTHTTTTVAFLRAQFPDLKMTIEAIVAEADLASVRIVATGTNLGLLNGMLPPTGRAFRAEQCHWFRIADGRLAEHWAIRDDLTAMLQLGAIARPSPAAAPAAAGPST